MKRHLLIVLCLLLMSISSMAQKLPQATNALDAKGLKTGQWIYFYDQHWQLVDIDAAIAFYRVVNYEKGKPTGKFTNYYRSGQVQSEGTLIAESPNQFEGEMVFYSAKGIIENKQFFDQGKLNPDKSLQLLEQVVDGYQNQLTKDPDYLISSRNLADAYQQSDRFDDAEPLLQKVLAIQKQQLGEQHPSHALNLVRLADLYRQAGKTDQAEEGYLKALKITKETAGEDDPDYVSAIKNLAGFYKKIGKPGEAEPLYLQAVAANKKVHGDHHPAYALSLNDLAVFYADALRFAEAEANYLESLKVLKTGFGEEHPEYPVIRNNLSLLYYAAGRFQEAAPIFKDVYEADVAQYGSNDIRIVNSMSFLAEVYMQMGQYIDAQPLFEKGLAIRKAQYGEESVQYVVGLSPLASLYSQMGDYQRSEKMYRKSLEILDKTIGKNNRAYAIVLGNFATQYGKIGRYAEQEALLLEAIARSKKQNGESSTDLSLLYGSLAGNYQSVGRYAEAESLYLKATEMTKSLLGADHLQYAVEILNLANLYRRMGKEKESEALHLEALEIQKKQLGPNHIDYGKMLSSLAALYNSIGRYEEAGPLYKESLSITKEKLGTDHLDYAFALSSVSRYYQTIDTLAEVTLGYYQEAGNIKKRVLGPQSPKYGSHLANQATFHYVNQSTDKALTLFAENLFIQQNHLENYFEQLGEAERDAFYKTVKDHFEQYADFAFREANDHPDLLSTVYNLQLRHKALLLNMSNKIKARILSSGDRKLIDLYDEVQQLKQVLGQAAALNDEDLLRQRGIKRDSLKQLLESKDEQLTAVSAIYREENKVPVWQDVQAKLQKGEAAVEIVRFRVYDYRKSKFTDQVKYAALIVTVKTKQHPTLVLFEDGNFLEEKAILRYSKSIEFKLDDPTSYEVFWKPLKPYLKKTKKVYFSPDGVFHSVNMKTLYNGEKGVFLRDEVNLELVTNSKDLLSVLEAPMKQKIALLVGNPAFGEVVEEGATEQVADISDLLASINRGAGLVPLPGTEKEVKQIQQLLKDNNWRETTVIDTDATEDKLKNMLKPNILHIATHGFFQENADRNMPHQENPLFRSGLLLTGAAQTLQQGKGLSQRANTDQEDGVLTAFEALNLNIDNSNLVVLSACETGLGDIRNGEGVFGLQRAFKLAGARTILMSLWKVNDQTTQEFMVSFYEHWLGGMSKRQAFDQAQVQLRAKYDHPYYWGAFVLIGE